MANLVFPILFVLLALAYAEQCYVVSGKSGCYFFEEASKIARKLEADGTAKVTINGQPGQKWYKAIFFRF